MVKTASTCLNCWENTHCEIHDLKKQKNITNNKQYMKEVLNKQRHSKENLSAFDGQLQKLNEKDLWENG